MTVIESPPYVVTHGINLPLVFQSPGKRYRLSIYTIGFLSVCLAYTSITTVILTHPSILSDDQNICAVLLVGVFNEESRPTAVITWAVLGVIGVLSILFSIECFIGNPDMHTTGDPGGHADTKCRCQLWYKVLLRSIIIATGHIGIAVITECILPVGLVSFSLVIELLLALVWLLLSTGVCCCRGMADRPIVPAFVLVLATLVIGILWLLPFGMHWDHLDHLQRYHWNSRNAAEEKDTYLFWKSHLPFLTPPFPIELAYASLGIALVSMISAVFQWKLIMRQEPLMTPPGALYASAQLQSIIMGWSCLSWLIVCCCACKSSRQSRGNSCLS